jgi:twinkle protein
MTARFSRNDRDFYHEQSEFVGRLVEFSKANNVHVHLVAHPRKAGEGNLIADDVGGSGDITNRADNVFSIKRIVGEDADFDAGLTILKNRYYGALGTKVRLCFDKTCNRFSEYGYTTDWRYGWETSKPDFNNISDIPF